MRETNQKRIPLFHLMSRNLALFMFAMVLANISGHMWMPLLPLYVQELGADVPQVGLYFTLSSVLHLGFQIFGGWLSDSIGRLRAAAVGSLAGLAGMIVMILSPSWQYLLIASLFESISFAFIAPTYMAYIAEESSEESRGRVYGMAQAIFMVVGVIGPPLGGMLSDRFSFRSMLLYATGLYVIATLFRLWMSRLDRMKAKANGTDTKPSFGKLKKDLATMAGLILAGGLITWILIVDGITDIVYRMSFELQPLYMENLMGLSKTQIGWLTSISSLITILCITPSGWLADKKGERVGILLGILFYSAGMGVFVLAGKFLGFLVSWLLFGIGNALLSPSYDSLISKAVPEKIRGTAFGLFSTSISFISLPAPYLGAQLWKHVNPRAPFIAPILASLPVLPIIWLKFKAPSRPADPEGDDITDQGAATELTTKI